MGALYPDYKGLSFDNVRKLPLPELSVKLLGTFGDQPSFDNFVWGWEQRQGSGQFELHVP